MFFSCIIPAYNEGPRIAAVIQAVLDCTEIDEVIVIDDGSTDNTWNVIDTFESPKLQKIKLEKNSGKTNTFFTGLHASKGTHIMMIDADLLNLTTGYIASLLEPITTRKVDVSISIRKNSLSFYKFLGTDFVSGERVLPRSIFSDEAYFMTGPGFGLEVKINEKIIESHYTYKNIYLQNLITPGKSIKYGFISGFYADIRMVREILSIMPLRKILYQLWWFSRFHRQ